MRQWVHINIFDRHLKPVISVLSASALGLADPAPVRGLIAGSGKAGSIDESLHQVKIMTVFCHPVLSQTPEAGGKDETGKMRDPYPWKDQKAGVVGYQAQVPTTGDSVPTDELISRGGFPGRRTEQQAGNGTPITVESDILHVFADMPFASEIMVSIHKAMEQIIIDTAFLNRHQGYRPDRT